MIRIVVEKSLGFGGGGWDTGYYIYIIHKGKVYKEIRAYDKEPTLSTIKSILKMLEVEYKIHRVDYPPKGKDFCKQLVKVLCKETNDAVS